MTSNGYGVSFWGDESVPKVIMMMVVTTLLVTATELYILNGELYSMCGIAQQNCH